MAKRDRASFGCAHDTHVDICKSLIIAGATAMLIALSAGSASAQSVSFTGSTSSDWTDPTNWTGGVVPGNTSNVTIGATANAPILGVNGAASGLANAFLIGNGSLTIENGSTLHDNGILNMGGTGSVSTLTVIGPGSQFNEGGILTLSIGGTGTINIENNGFVGAAAGVRLTRLATDAGTINIGGGGTLQTSLLTAGPGSAQINFDNGILRPTASNASFLTSFAVSKLNIAAGGATIDTAGFSIGALGFSGVGGLTEIGGGTLILTGASTYTGATNIQSGTLALTGTGSISTSSSVVANSVFDISGLTNGGTSIQSLAGGGSVYLGANNITITNANDLFSGVISGTGGLIITGGTQTLSGINSYSGATTINGGTLAVNGAITSSSGVTVNNGGTLAGAGSVGGTTVNAGGTLMPGNGTPGTTMTVNGNLALAPGSIYSAAIGPMTASLAAVSGTTTVSGMAQANFVNGAYISKTYKILSSNGGVSGTFSGLSNINLPNNFTDALSYDANNAYLDLTLNYANPAAPNFTPLNANQANVANTLLRSFNTNGGIPTALGTLSSAGLTQADGELNTGAEHTAFQLESQFLNVMLDPFIDGRFGREGEGTSATANVQPLGYTSEQSIFSPAVSQAYGRVLKGSPPVVYVPHWNAWGTAFGGVSYSNGNTATGSNQLNANTFGFAAGIDYHLSADTVFGFALGGGGTNWQLASIGGTGRSSALQTGIYAITRNGPLYGAAAFGFSNNWFTTNRTALGDQLQANFGGQSYGGRVEGGYHIAALPFGFTPYGALQAQDFETPNYNETDLTGGGFGLSYASMSATDVRTELGSRFEQATVLGAMPLILHGKLAWAHDFVSNPALNAAFQVLPGTSFTVYGAPIPHDSALVSAGAELLLAPNWSVLAKFDGEFAGTAQTYAGTGTLKYTW